MYRILLFQIYQLRSASNPKANVVQKEGEGITAEDMFWETVKKAQVAILTYTNAVSEYTREDENKTIRENFQYLTRSRIDLTDLLVSTFEDIRLTPLEYRDNVLFCGYSNLTLYTRNLQTIYEHINEKTLIDENEVKQKGDNALKEIEEGIEKSKSHKELMQTYAYRELYEARVTCGVIESYNNNHTQKFSAGYEEKQKSYIVKTNKINKFSRNNSAGVKLHEL